MRKAAHAGHPMNRIQKTVRLGQSPHQEAPRKPFHARPHNSPFRLIRVSTIVVQLLPQIECRSGIPSNYYRENLRLFFRRSIGVGTESLRRELPSGESEKTVMECRKAEVL